jgi:hypothetical protein
VRRGQGERREGEEGIWEEKMMMMMMMMTMCVCVCVCLTWIFILYVLAHRYKRDEWKRDGRKEKACVWGGGERHTEERAEGERAEDERARESGWASRPKWRRKRRE